MTEDCAKELLDLIMLDDFVARRDALFSWRSRWVVELEFEHSSTQAKALEFIARYGKAQAAQIEKVAMQDKLSATLLRADEEYGLQAVGFECVDEGSTRKVIGRVGVLLSKPRESK